MTAGQLNRALQHLRAAVLSRETDGLADGDLLELFIRRRDETAFEALLRRHGPMVLGVCRRVLGNGPDAEDAFQATFLVLVRKAATVRPRDRVGSWLYGVAHRTAREARRAASRRRAREARAAPRVAATDNPCSDLRPLLDRELARLPDSYRAVLVLCDLEGQSRKEAARRLGWPEGTVASRLARARSLLARRLARHGLPASGGVVAGLLAQGTAPAQVPEAFLGATVQVLTGPAEAAAAQAPFFLIAKGVTNAMLMAKLKVATAVLLALGMLGLGATGLTYRTPATAQTAPEPNTTPVVQVPANTPQQFPAANTTVPRAEFRELLLENARLRIDNALKKLAEAKDDKAEQEALHALEEAVKRLRTGLRRSGKPAASLVPLTIEQPEEIVSPSRQMRIPIRVDPARKGRLKEVRLFVSDDGGRSWGLAAMVRPDQESIAYRAPGEGVFWFVLVTVDDENKQDPPDIAAASPQLKVRIKLSTP